MVEPVAHSVWLIALDQGRTESLKTRETRKRVVRTATSVPFAYEGIMEPMLRAASREESFTGFVLKAEPHLRRALVSAFGHHAGREAVADALAYGWEHWDRIGRMKNPVGYLYRVAMRIAAKSALRRRPVLEREGVSEVPWVEPRLAGALAGLSSQQRTAVLLVRGHGYTHREAADLMGGIGISTVEKHVERAIAKLRRHLEVTVDVDS